MRHGTAYRTMKAVESVKHVSDLGKLPQGAGFVKTVTRYAYEQTVRVVEHEYHLVTYRLNGVMYTAYLPAEGEPKSSTECREQRHRQTSWHTCHSTISF